MTTTDWAVDSAVPQSNPHETADFVALDERWGTHNYHPLPVVIAHADGAWVTDVEGRRYLDFLAGYSALNFGHRHPDLVAAAVGQLGRVTLTSRAFHHDQLGLFCRELAELTGTEMVLPMNSGAEAVESAIKVARKWAYQVKGVPADTAEIVVAGSNFHGRTTTIVSFSTDPVVHARVHRGRVRRRRGPGRRRDRADGRRAGGADPGRGRRAGAAARLPARGAPDL
jgi:ornithine--oxo-acid transaminase